MNLRAIFPWLLVTTACTVPLPARMWFDVTQPVAKDATSQELGVVCNCGDGKCDFTCDESATACPADCGTACGNKACDKGESPATCAIDCQWQVCGNGICEPMDGGPSKCPSDCGASCGNCTCEKGESFADCPIDCGSCGDGVCSSCALLQEDAVHCPVDCAESGKPGADASDSIDSAAADGADDADGGDSDAAPPQCSVLGSAACKAGEQCFPNGDKTLCVKAGVLLAGAPCKSYNDCAVGTLCVAGTCRALCDASGQDVDWLCAQPAPCEKIVMTDKADDSLGVCKPCVGAQSWASCPPAIAVPGGKLHGQACSQDADCLYGMCMFGLPIAGYDKSVGVCSKNCGMSGGQAACSQDGDGGYACVYEKSQGSGNAKRDPIQAAFKMCGRTCKTDSDCMAWNPDLPTCAKSSTASVSVGPTGVCIRPN